MKRVYRLIVVSVCLFAACTTGNKKENTDVAQSRYQLLQGINYYKAKQFHQAQEAITKSLASNPGSAKAHLMSALINQQLGLTQRAEIAFQNALSIKPLRPETVNNYANFLCGNGDYLVAESYFEQAANMENNPKPAIALTNAGLCASKSGDYAKAGSWYQKALANNPAQATALYQLSQIEVNQGRPLEASTLLNQFLQHRKHSAKTLLLGARIEKALGNDNNVKNYLQRLAIDFPASKENRNASAILARKSHTTITPSNAPVRSVDTSSSTKDSILSRSPDHYTLQIIATKNLNLSNQIKNSLQSGWLPMSYQFTKNDAVWYTVLEGDYPSSEAARQGLVRLPASTMTYQPWIRRFDSIQRVISRQ